MSGNWTGNYAEVGAKIYPVLHSCHVALFAASCSTRLGLWILPVGVRASCAAVRKASRAATL